VATTVKLNLVSRGRLDEGELCQRRDKMDKHRDKKGVWAVRYSGFMDNVIDVGK
jgi:hypothetical protein